MTREKRIFQRKYNLVSFSLFFACLFAGYLSAEEYIVKLKYDLKEDEDIFISPIDQSYNIVDHVAGFDLIKIQTEFSESSEDTISNIKNYFDAEYVVKNSPVFALGNAQDPKRAEQYALDKVGADEAWAISSGSQSVVVAVIDTGVKLDHEDLLSNIWTNAGEIAGNNIDDDNNGFVDDNHGWDFSANDNDPSDEAGHGTHCSGIIGAVCGNSLGICGISPVVSIMALRFLDKNGSGDLFASIKAIDYAITKGAHIISASWGANISQSEAQPLVDAIKKAEESGVIFVAAAANDGKSNDSASVYPANAQTPNMLSVAASNAQDEKPYWSNYGRKVDIAAPGDNIMSCLPSGYGNLSGTSMATPLVAGALALMKSLDISLTGAQGRSILQATGQAVNIETASNRRIAVDKAMEAVANKQLTLVPAAATFKAQDNFAFSAWGGQAPYKFRSLNPEIATIDEGGNFVAIADGEAVIEVSDANGQSASSVSVLVSSGQPDEGSKCPFPPEFCSILCSIDPSLPWCNS